MWNVKNVKIEVKLCVYLVDVGVSPAGSMFLRNADPSPHGVPNQKTNIDIFTAVMTSNLFRLSLFWV
jgi:hypothetical protein